MGSVPHPAIGIDTGTRINAITEQVIACAFKVSNTLGRGYLEKVYENALAHECRKTGLRVDQQLRLLVKYDDVVVGDYVADIVIESLVVLEIKAARSFDSAHEAQCINYLAATGLPICLLLNFGTRVEVRRFAGPAALAFPSLQTAKGPIPMTWAEAAEHS